MAKLKAAITISITPEENETVKELMKKGYTQVGIFRKALKIIKLENEK